MAELPLTSGIDIISDIRKEDIGDNYYSINEIGHHSNHIISGTRKNIIEFRIRFQIFLITLKHFWNPFKIYKILRKLDYKRRLILGENRINKIVKVDGKYYWDLYTPGFKSKSFSDFIKGEIGRIIPVRKKTNRFTNIFIAITKKCSLQCEHCFEWDALNQKETLSLPDLKKIVNDFQDKGTAIIQLTGGEPLLKIDTIVEILESSKRNTEFWILTSGYNLTAENAKRLKKSGLTGIVISLDHFDPELHNQFRGFKKSFEWVEKGVENSNDAGLICALSLCPTRAFITEENLAAYATLAKNMGVSFVQILEPKAVGHYKNKDVELSNEQKLILENFYLKFNYSRKYNSFPIISYHGYHQKRTGCFGAGNRNLYVDTDGDIHACPFCQHKSGNTLTDDLENTLKKLQESGCHNFSSAEI